MGTLMRRSLAIAALSVAMVGQAVPGNEQLPKDRAGGDMFLDAFFARPAGLIAIVAGAAGFVVSLPFTLISGSVDSAASELIKKPIDYTFRRPLGQLEEQE